MAVQPVSIAYGNGCDAGGTLDFSPTAVTDRRPWLDVVDLKNGGFERSHVVQYTVVYRVNAVKSQAETDHVQVALGESFDACRIADMAQDAVGKLRLQIAGASVETLKLQGGEIVEIGAVAAYEMREDATGNKGFLRFEIRRQSFEFGLWVE